MAVTGTPICRSKEKDGTISTTLEPLAAAMEVLKTVMAVAAISVYLDEHGIHTAGERCFLVKEGTPTPCPEAPSKGAPAPAVASAAKE